LSDFEDVPEDHYWAVAIGWAEDMGIAVADEDGNFRPDDLVLRSTEDVEGELQEFLNRYAVYAGIKLDKGELFIKLAGAADDVIMGEEAQAIFNEFFAKLEAALAQAA
ncbi:MAG: S-layer homology domain-containing protein, partial [Clostridiales bacterium]|nr:S-layer homology domain-containing protein [Clostridiales bacterium]